MAYPIARADSALITQNLKTTSLIIAEKFGKRHDSVIRAIEELEIPKKYRLLNFEETVTERPNPSGGAPIKSKAYELTRDGFCLLVMGFTSKAAMRWKIKFLQAFNAMERELIVPTLPSRTLPPLPFTMAELTQEASELLLMSGEAASQAAIIHSRVSSLFSKVQHNMAFTVGTPKAPPAPQGTTNVRAHTRKLPVKQIQQQEKST